MKLSELIKKGTEALTEHGDMEVVIDDWQSKGSMMDKANEAKIVGANQKKPTDDYYHVLRYKNGYMSRERRLKETVKVFLICQYSDDDIKKMKDYYK